MDLLDFSSVSERCSKAFLPLISEASAPSGSDILIPEIVLLIDFVLSMDNLFGTQIMEFSELGSVLEDANVFPSSPNDFQLTGASFKPLFEIDKFLNAFTASKT